MSVVDNSFGYPLRAEEKATIFLAGGIAGQGYQCGMLWGAALAAGAQAYRVYGSDSKAEAAAIIASQKAVDIFRTQSKDEINCLEITDLNLQGENQLLPILKFFLKGGPIGCLGMAARYAPLAFREIDVAFSDENFPVPSAPVSCSTMLAKKMGASKIHAVMAAGLAGGIGLSGGACGALGTAIWIQAMNRIEEPAGIDFSVPWIDKLIKKFVESSDYEFECSKIVGRKFESIPDHAEYTCKRGCSNIIDTLAAP